jgi:hypothetical protein
MGLLAALAAAASIAAGEMHGSVMRLFSIAVAIALAGLTAYETTPISKKIFDHIRQQ